MMAAASSLAAKSCFSTSTLSAFPTRGGGKWPIREAKISENSAGHPPPGEPFADLPGKIGSDPALYLHLLLHLLLLWHG